MDEREKELVGKWLGEFEEQPLQVRIADLIKVSEEFHFNGKSLWLGMERTSDPSEDLTIQFLKAHEELVTAFKAISGQTLTDSNSGTPEIIDLASRRAKETMEKLIDDASTVEELVKYKDQVVQYGLVDMYADKMDFLQATSK